MIRRTQLTLLISMISVMIVGMGLMSCVPGPGATTPAQKMTEEAAALQTIEAALRETPPGPITSTPTPAVDVKATAQELARIYLTQTAEAAPTATHTPALTPLPPTPTPVPPAPTPLPPTPTPVPPTPTPKPPPPPPGLLAYTVTEVFRQHYRIELINTDGTGHRVLVDMASEPSFSSDGRQVVFYSWPGGLEVMKLDGSGRHRIVHDMEAAFPAWSPDGKFIAFHSVRGWSSRFNIYIVNADGSGERMLVDGEQATWSPDSSRLVYKGCEGSHCGLMIINADGTGKRRLTTCDECANDGNPDWSRDTNRIVFTSERDGNHEIYVMNPDGSGQTRLTNHPGPDALPVWLPGGQQIAFRSFRDGQWGIYIMNADGSGVRKLTDARVDPNRWIWEKMAATRR